MKSERLIIDRFEGDLAVCEREDGTMVNIERSMMPETATEGSVLTLASGKYELDAEATLERAQLVGRLATRLWNGNKPPS